MRKDNFWEQICFLTFLVFACTFTLNAQYKIEVLDSNTFQLGEGVVLHKTSFRGLSVVNDQTIWVSGSRGTIARSIDGGKTFVYKQLKNYPKSDFRDIEAFDANRAIIMSSGTPALILKTTDGGETWKEVFRKNDSAYFLDAMDFWDDKRGMLVGDPINFRFLILQTNDGGETWKEWDSGRAPEAFRGEAVFAASGTSLRCGIQSEIENTFAFVSGGSYSRLFEFSNELGDYYCHHREELPMIKGASSGAFSLVYSKSSQKYVAIVGGDYMNYNTTDSGFVTGLLKTEGCIVSWDFKMRKTSGYRSSIEELDDDVVIVCGTNGVECGFVRLKKISNEPFHVVRKAKKGKAVFLAGPGGKIGKLAQ